MAYVETLRKVKADLRITHTALDEDLQDQIDACMADLDVTAGVSYHDETDPLILSAIKLWCRAHYTDDTGKADAYMARYNAMKGSLEMAAGYGGNGDDD